MQTTEAPVIHSPAVSAGSNTSIDLEYARKVIRAEASAVASIEQRIDAEFLQAAQLILQLHPAGRVVVSGMGKAGIMGQKIAATFASTGTPALFMHPAEALHGDLGMVTEHDVLLAFSNSGESDELLKLLPVIKRIGCGMIAITASRKSSLGRASRIVLEIGAIEEPCPLRMAPSASTIAMLAMGDALALTVLKARGFSREDFALLHPGGELGRKLLRVQDTMRTGERMVKVPGSLLIAEALIQMQKTRNGAAVVVDDKENLRGIFTHGDFSRVILKNPHTINEPIEKHMTSPCKHIFKDALVMDAQQTMHQCRINALPVVDETLRVLGLLDIQDLV